MDGKKSFTRFMRARGWVMIVDMLLICALLAGFAYLHHGMDKKETGSYLVSCRSGVLLKLEEGFEAAYDESGVGVFDFEGRFTANEPETTVNGDTTYYRDGGCEIAITDYAVATGRVQVADVYISDITMLSSGMASSL